MAVPGVLPVFSRVELMPAILDLKGGGELVPAVAALAGNLAAGFIVGIAAAYLLRSERFRV